MMTTTSPARSVAIKACLVSLLVFFSNSLSLSSAARTSEVVGRYVGSLLFAWRANAPHPQSQDRKGRRQNQQPQQRVQRPHRWLILIRTNFAFRSSSSSALLYFLFYCCWSPFYLFSSYPNSSFPSHPFSFYPFAQTRCWWWFSRYITSPAGAQKAASMSLKDTGCCGFILRKIARELNLWFYPSKDTACWDAKEFMGNSSCQGQLPIIRDQIVKTRSLRVILSERNQLEVNLPNILFANIQNSSA